MSVQPTMVAVVIIAPTLRAALPALAVKDTVWPLMEGAAMVRLQQYPVLNYH